MIPRPTSSQFRDVKMATGYSLSLFIPGSAQFVYLKQKLFETHHLFIQHNPLAAGVVCARINTKNSIEVVDPAVQEFWSICPLRERIMDHGSEFGDHRREKNGVFMKRSSYQLQTSVRNTFRTRHF